VLWGGLGDALQQLDIHNNKKLKQLLVGHEEQSTSPGSKTPQKKKTACATETMIISSTELALDFEYTEHNKTQSKSLL
jgi:hypothetical protein